ncbi:trehalose-phosphatase [Enterovirga rhinocerotis]|uniref:trehalose-phosphatase n=1 Tax=Enterovirga rhinocerotis TaxID=1339210 RepID=UPI00105BEDF7|nr:trehalose-phosphatase [Enterovirga rhinocerotis]
MDAPWALFLDFDGTLVDIAERPDAVVVEAGLPASLSALWQRLDGALAIVTGRTVEVVTGFLGDPGFDVCGMHGLERRVGGRLSRPDGLADLGTDVAALRSAFADRPGVLVEDKGVGVALHWRLAPEAEADALAAMAALAARLGEGYRIQDGKAVREIVPAASGKGGAIRALMEHPPYLGRIPVFAGDDRTDESGFEAVNALGGISIKLGDGPTAAAHRLPSAPAFRAWLHRWAEGVTGPSDLPAS